jgi:antitoxin HigA-1
MLSGIVHGHARVTPDVAALLGKALGNGPGLWLRLQADWDAEHIDPETQAKVERIQTLERVA